MIGIFAIEELDERDETLRVSLLEETRLNVEGLRDGESYNKEIKALSERATKRRKPRRFRSVPWHGAGIGKARSKRITGHIIQ